MFYKGIDLNIDGFVVIYDSSLAFKVGELQVENVYILSLDIELLFY
jgi:hypothetical protein